jgi:hypothetical protein
MATMPFGKHKGEPLSEIPDDYLEWLLSGEITLRPWLREAITTERIRRILNGRGSSNQQSHANGNGSNWRDSWDEFTRRYGEERQAPRSGARRLPAGVTREAALQIVEEGRRSAAKKVHPDVGGNGEDMKAINVTHDWLRALVLSVFDGGGGFPWQA